MQGVRYIPRVDYDMTGAANVMSSDEGRAATERREYLAGWRHTSQRAYLTGYPKSRRLARKLTAAANADTHAAMNPLLNIAAPATKKAGRPPVVYRNLVPLRIAGLMVSGLAAGMAGDRVSMQDDDTPEVSGLPLWLDDIISGALVWDDAKGTAHKLSPFWMRKVVMLPVISTATIMELTGLSKQSASRYMTNGILACKFILQELNRQELAGLGLDSNGNSPIVV